MAEPVPRSRRVGQQLFQGAKDRRGFAEAPGLDVELCCGEGHPGRPRLARQRVELLARLVELSGSSMDRHESEPHGGVRGRVGLGFVQDTPGFVELAAATKRLTKADPRRGVLGLQR